MKATSHFAMAHLLHAGLQSRGIYLNRVAFVYGNIAPDYTPAMWVAPHFSKVCAKTISELVNELSMRSVSPSGRIGAEYSKQLGLMCHFICDYFCFAHGDDFTGSLKQHMAYENLLDSYLRRHCLELLDLEGGSPLPNPESAAALSRNLEQKKSGYLSAGHSLNADLSSAFDACMEAIFGLVQLSKCLPAACMSHDLDDFLSALKGYATGNNFVFKVFFFKYRNANLFFLPDLMPPILAS